MTLPVRWGLVNKIVKKDGALVIMLEESEAMNNVPCTKQLICTCQRKTCGSYLRC